MRSITIEYGNAACIDLEVRIYVIAIQIRPDDKGKRNTLVAKIKRGVVRLLL